MTYALNAVKDWLDRRAVSRFMNAVAAVSFILALFVGIHQYQLASCLATYSDQSSAATTQRAAANEATNEAIDAVITAIANARDLSPAQRDAAVGSAFGRYLTARAAADERRLKNPIPEPPSETCH